ncbi:MAG: histidinol-phosphate transaminase [Paracoccaceae bacterium]|nr:histidinol-phosphate transaminase [Paracoccaceae bacterium]
MIRPNDHIRAMRPYALADLAGSDSGSAVSLAQNESLRPPSPKAIAAAKSAAEQGALYPDPDWTKLRAVLAELHGLDPADILCGAGSLDLIGCIARAYAGPGHAVLMPEHAYPFFGTAARMAGARLDQAPEHGTTVSVDALLEAVQPDTSLVFVANPGNPTGTGIPRPELERLRSGLPESALLIIDEAYGEFSDGDGEAAFCMVEDGGVAVLRTLSKAYGLAGFRVGWGFFPSEIAGEVRKVMNPNNISATSQAAAAEAVRDQVYMRETCAMTAAIRDDARDRLIAGGFLVEESRTNFLLIQFDAQTKAESADRALRKQGVFLRGQSAAGLGHALRMTIGPHEATDAAVNALLEWNEEDMA